MEVSLLDTRFIFFGFSLARSALPIWSRSRSAWPRGQMQRSRAWISCSSPMWVILTITMRQLPEYGEHSSQGSGSGACGSISGSAGIFRAKSFISQGLGQCWNSEHHSLTMRLAWNSDLEFSCSSRASEVQPASACGGKSSPPQPSAMVWYRFRLLIVGGRPRRRWFRPCCRTSPAFWFWFRLSSSSSS